MLTFLFKEKILFCSPGWLPTQYTLRLASYSWFPCLRFPSTDILVVCYHIQPKVIVFRSIPAGSDYSVLVVSQSCPYTLHKPSFRSCWSFLDNLKSIFSIEGPCLTHVRPTCAQERRHMESHEDVGNACHRSLCQSPNLIVFKCSMRKGPFCSTLLQIIH